LGQVWWTGTAVRIEWDWRGYVNHPVDVTVLDESRPGTSVQVASIITQWTGPWTGWVVPYNFALGPYTIRVASSKNPNNHAELRVLIKDSTITVTSPNSNFTMANGSTYPIYWNVQGKPGPVKIELNTTLGGTPMLIANNVPPGDLGVGKFDWQVFENLAPAGNYLVKVTSLASSTITGTSRVFAIARPSITILKPLPGDRCLPGVYVPITWKSVGNLGAMVRITAWPANGSGLSLDLQHPRGNGGQGGYDGWMPATLPVSQKYFIRVESILNRSIAGELSSPITVMAQQGASSDHGGKGNATVPPYEGYVSKVTAKIKTGGDDLRGGRDNLNITVYLKDGDQQSFNNVNRSARWADHTDRTVTMVLKNKKNVHPEDITLVTLETTSSAGGIIGGSVGVDNWDMDHIELRAQGNGVDSGIGGYGFKRFTGDSRMLNIFTHRMP